MPLAVLALLLLLSPAEAGRKKNKRAESEVAAAEAPPADATAPGMVVLPCPYAPGRIFTWDMTSTGSNPATGTARFTGLQGPPGVVHVRVESTVEREAKLSSSVVDEALARLPADAAPVVAFEPATRGLHIVNLEDVVAATGPALEAVLTERYADADAQLLAYTRQLARDPGMVTSAVLQGKAILFLQTCVEAPLDEKLEQRIQMPAPVGGKPLDATSSYLVTLSGDRAVIEAEEASMPGAMAVIVDGMVEAELLDPELAEELRDFRMASTARTEITLADGVIQRSTASLTLEGAGVGKDTADVRTFTLRP